MATTTIVTEGQTAASSTTQSVAAGSTVTVSLFTSSAAGIPPSVAGTIRQITPGLPRVLGYIYGKGPGTQVVGPVEFQVDRPNIAEFGINVGVALDA